MRSFVQYDLPYRAKNAAGQATDATLTDQLQSGAWLTTIAPKVTTDHVVITPPHKGSLSIPASNQIALDVRMFAALTFDFMRIPFLPLIAKFVFSDVAFTDFAPTRAVARLAKRQGITNAAAALALLQQLQSTAGSRIDVYPGEPIGTVGPSGPSSVVCQLLDGSTVPLEFAYRFLFVVDPTMLTGRVKSWLPSPLPGYRAAGPFLDLVVPDDQADPFQSLPGASPRSGTLTVTFDDPATTTDQVTVAPQMRRFIVPLPSNLPSTSQPTIGLQVDGVPVPVSSAGGTQLGTNWQLGPPPPNYQLPDSPIPITVGAAIDAIRVLKPPVVSVSSPPNSPTPFDGAVAISPPSPAGPTMNVQFEGVSSSGATMTATLLNGASVQAPVNGFHWSVTVAIPLGSGPQFVAFTDDSSSAPTTTVAVIAATINLPSAAVMPGVPGDAILIAKHDAAGDTCDSVDLAATIPEAAAITNLFGHSTYSVDWTLEIDTAVPWSQELGHSAQGHWIPEQFVATASGVPLTSSWDPPPLIPQAVTRQGFNRDDDWKVLGLDQLGTWSGNSGSGAGPLCGGATLGALIRKDGVQILTLTPRAFHLTGYNFYNTRWASFFDWIATQVSTRFPTGYPVALGWSQNDLAKVILAIIQLESTYNHFFTNINPAPIAGPPNGDPPPNNINFFGMPAMRQDPTGAPVGSDSGVGMIFNPTFAQFFDWRANVSRAVEILSKPARRAAQAFRDTLLKVEGVRLTRLAPSAQRNTAKDDLANHQDELDAFADAIISDQGRCQDVFVTLYNGWADGPPLWPPYISPLTWDASATAFDVASTIPNYTMQGAFATRNNFSATYKQLVLGVRLRCINACFDPSTPYQAKDGTLLQTIADFYTQVRAAGCT